MFWNTRIQGALAFPAGGVATWKAESTAVDRKGWKKEGLFSREAEPRGETVADSLEHIASSARANAAGVADVLRIETDGDTVTFAGEASRDLLLDINADLGAAICAAARHGARGDVWIAEDTGEIGFRFEVKDGKCKLSSLTARQIQAMSREAPAPPETPSDAVSPPTPSAPRADAPRAPAVEGMWAAAPEHLRALHAQILGALEGASPAAVREAARREGLAVYVKPFGEKPLAELFEDTAALLRALRSGDERMQLGHAMHFERALQSMLRLVAAVDPQAAGRILEGAPIQTSMVGYAVAEILGALGTEEGLGRLLEAFAAPATQNVAATGLLASRHPGADARMVEALSALSKEPATPQAAAAAGELARILGARKSAAAVPALLRAWEQSTDPNLRAAAATALVQGGAPEALRALASAVSDPHGAVQDAAIASVLTLDPASAFDTLAPHFEDTALASPARRSTAAATLRALVADATLQRTPRPGATFRGWLGADPRWIELSLRLVRHPDVGHLALAVLPFGGADRVLPTLLSLLGEADIDALCSALRTLGDARAISPLEQRVGGLKKKGDQTKVKKLVAELKARQGSAQE